VASTTALLASRSALISSINSKLRESNHGVAEGAQSGAGDRVEAQDCLPASGRIERFFTTVMFLCELDGYALADGAVRGKPTLTLAEFR
jgi:hypothetical protein